ncbi:ATP-dependent RNA helicase Ddx1, partial [Biomphalaria glabrata]
VCMVDPTKDTRWKKLEKHIKTDGVHEKDRTNIDSPGKFLDSCFFAWAHVYTQQPLPHSLTPDYIFT